FRQELTTRHGRAAVTALTISDGATLWRGRRTGDGPWTDVLRVDLQQALQPSDHTIDRPDAGEEIPNLQASRGGVGLLQTLRSRIDWSSKETVRRDGRAFLKLTGSWSPKSTAAQRPTDQLGTDGLPRQARLYLDVETLWPHRVEWWGPASPRAADVLLH